MNRNSPRLLLFVAATLFFSSAFPNPAPAQTISFIAGGNYAVGANPSSVAVGDFNRDGRPDLAVANYGSNKQNDDVSVLLGNGDGTFQAARTFDTGTYTAFVVVVDVNNDDGRAEPAADISSDTN